MKKIAILGSTGSIGTQTLEVVRGNGDIEVLALAAGGNIRLLEEQIREFHPKLAAVWKEEKAKELRENVCDLDVKIVSGMDGLLEVAVMPGAKTLVTAIVGMIGIRPTIEAIKAGKDIALANKETLVTAGHIIMPLAKECGVSILPVDSEHSAIFQSLQGGQEKALHKILLTASGGPFRGKKRKELEQIQVEEKALRYIAKSADGAMRDALSLLDQCIAFHFGEELTYDKVLDILGAVDTEVFGRLLRHVLQGDVTGCIGLLEEVVMQGRELGQFVTDLTWYLRNLLLVKSSDDIENVIDVSSDNLARMREEADLLETAAIMRYIRIFSELSGQIKYAAQKRILIEIALIKLCRPSMEKDHESVLERIRAVEEKLEKGIAVMPSGGVSEGNSSDQAWNRPQEPKERPTLPKAIPEDVQTIVSKWPSIVGRTSMPMKQYLKDANLSLGGDNRLTIVVEDGLASDYFLRQEGHKELLIQTLSEAVGKEIDVTIQSVPDQNTFAQNYVDLSQVIHMEIEEVEE